MTTKICTKCGEEKPEDQFSWKVKDVRRRADCKECCAKASSEHYKNNKDEYINRNTVRRNKKRAMVRGILDKSSCIACGEDCNACLDFHHPDPSLKDGNVSILVSDLRSDERILNEISKCVVICSNCHRKVHAGLLDISV